MESLTGLVAVFIPIVAILFPIMILYVIFYFGTKEEKQFHDTLQELIKSGQEITPDILAGIPGYVGNKDDIRTGTITSATGIGIALFGYFGPNDSNVLGIGLLVCSIGIGILIYGIYKKNKDADDNS